MDDISLLKDYVDRQDQQAFAQVVGRHGGWMYSTARRELRDEHLAEDVTQAVFAMLSKRAGRLRRYGYISGWLFLALGYCIKETKRRRMQQTKGEKEVASMRREAVEAKWDDVAPELDAAVRKLGKSDREALLLRFYEQRPLAEVGNALGISEEAARMRVQRAVEKLRGILGKKGVTGTTAGLSAVLVGNVVGQMPEGLVEKIVAAVGSGGGNSAAAAIAKGAMKMMTMAKVKVAAIMFLAVVGVGVVVAQHGPATGGAATGTGASGNTNVGQADASRDEIIRILRSARGVADQVESGRGLAEVVETTDGKTTTRELAFWFRGSASRVDNQGSADGTVSFPYRKWFDDGTRSVALTPFGYIMIVRSGSLVGYRDCGSDFHPAAMAALARRRPMEFGGVIDNILSGKSDARMTTTVDGRIRITGAYKYPEGGNKSSKTMVEVDPKQDMHVVSFDHEQLNDPRLGFIARTQMDVTWAQKDGVWYVAEAHRIGTGNLGPEGLVPTQTVDLRVRIKEYEPKVPVADAVFMIGGLGVVAGTPVYDESKGTTFPTYRYR